MIPATGERALICGQTGSGKTAFACWLLREIEPTPFVIYDTKFEPKFDALPGARRVHDRAGAESALDDEKVDFVIYTPHEGMLHDKRQLDALLWHHYLNWQGVGVYIDEVTQFSDRFQTEPGLLSILSRGRSKGITTIMSTQRPKGLSMSCLTEAQHFYMFALTDIKDLKRFDDYLEGYSKSERLIVGEHKFHYKEIGKPGPAQLYNPVPIDDNSHSGYVDLSPGEIAEGITPAEDDEAGASDGRSLIWL